MLQLHPLGLPVGHWLLPLPKSPRQIGVEKRADDIRRRLEEADCLQPEEKGATRTELPPQFSISTSQTVIFCLLAWAPHGKEAMVFLCQTIKRQWNNSCFRDFFFGNGVHFRFPCFYPQCASCSFFKFESAYQNQQVQIDSAMERLIINRYFTTCSSCMKCLPTPCYNL